MKKRLATVAAAFALAAGGLAAQTLPATPAGPQNVLQLAATGSVEVAQDLVAISLTTTREGSDPSALQAQLKSALDAALAEARRAAEPGQVDVHTGVFSIAPHYAPTGARIASWTGTVELVIEGRDFARIAQLAGRIPVLTVNNVSFGLSRELRARVETDAQSQAIERFKTKAGEIARGFGFTGYTLREVTVAANDFTPGPRLRMASAGAAMPASASPVPMEAGRATVTVTVSGSVQLR